MLNGFSSKVLRYSNDLEIRNNFIQ